MSKLPRVDSREYFSPAMSAPQRQATLPAAILSLVSTILGGGVLSLPFAFAQSGIVVGGLFLLVIALMSDFSIYILISCSRRAQHANTFENVAAAAYGPRMRVVTLVLLFILCYLCCIAYLLLIRDLISPIVEIVIGISLPYWGRVGVMISALVLLLPLCLRHSLASLTWSSLSSVCSVCVLGLSITFRSLQSYYSATSSPLLAQQLAPLKLFPDSIGDALYAFPIMSVAYLCHFNVVPLHSELQAPTRRRVKQLVHGVISLCTALYMLVGITGYMYARDHINGNILNNFSSSDLLITVGRVGLSCTCMMTFPLLVLPCRNALVRLIAVAYSANSTSEYEQIADNDDDNDDEDDEQAEKKLANNHIYDDDDKAYPEADRDIKAQKQRVLSSVEDGYQLASTPRLTQQSPRFAAAVAAASSSSINNSGSANSSISSSSIQHSPFILSSRALPPTSNSSSSLTTTPLSNNQDALNKVVQESEAAFAASNAALTLFIIVSVLLIAMSVESVATLWNVMGSSVSIVIAYIFPAAFYLKIRAAKPMSLRKLGAYALLIGGVALCITCTTEAVISLIRARVTEAAKP